MKNFYLSSILIDEVGGTTIETIHSVYNIKAFTFDEAVSEATRHITKAPRSYWKWSLNQPKGYNVREVK